MVGERDKRILMFIARLTELRMTLDEMHKAITQDKEFGLVIESTALWLHALEDCVGDRYKRLVAYEEEFGSEDEEGASCQSAN